MLDKLADVKIMEWLTLLALFLGPILSIRIQKILDYHKEHRSRQLHIFRTLMATRATKLAPEHITALNMIDSDFSEKKKKEKPVVRAWRMLLDQLGKYPRTGDYPNQDEYRVVLHTAYDRANEYLVDLLLAMSESLGYDFERVHIKNGCYVPTGHIKQEEEQELLRKKLIGMFDGTTAVNMKITSLPEQSPNEEAMRFLQSLAARQEEGLNLLKKIVKEEGHIKVTVENK